MPIEPWGDIWGDAGALVSSHAPPLGTSIEPRDAIVFDLPDIPPDVVRVRVSVFVLGSQETIYDYGAFASGYVRSEIAGDVLTVRRSRGWPDEGLVRFRIEGFNRSGVDLLV